MFRRNYIHMTCTPVRLETGTTILAESVNRNSTVSSVGQEIGTEETFIESDFINTSWETGTD